MKTINKKRVFAQFFLMVALLHLGEINSVLFAQSKSATQSTKKTTKPSTKAAPGKTNEKNSSPSTQSTPATPSSGAPASATTNASTQVSTPVAGKISEDVRSLGKAVMPAKPLPRSLKRPATPWKFTTEELRLSTTTGSLWGTLIIPTNATTTASVPVLIIISTNTVYDRDGNSTYAKDFGNAAKYLAEELAGQGIAVFRYDTRAVGRSKNSFGNEINHDFERTVSDACGFIDSLRNDKRLGAITVMGYSRPNDFGREGGLAGIVAAWKKQVDGLIVVAPESRRWLRYLREQAAMSYPEQTAREVDSLAAMMENGLRPRLTNKDGILFDLMRPTLQPYILSLNKYNPVEVIAKLTIPIIGVHGTMDYSISEEHTKNIVAANPKASFFSIKNMSFNLKDGNLDLATLGPDKGKLPVLPEVVDTFANFIHGIEKQP